MRPEAVLRLTELDYTPTRPSASRHCCNAPGASSSTAGAAAARPSRYDILRRRPSRRLTTRGATTEIVSAAGIERSDRDPLDLLRERLGPRVLRRRRACRSPAAPSATSLTTSAAGSSGCRASPPPTSRLPDMAVGLYDWAVVVDHHERRSWLVGAGRDERTFSMLGRAASRALHRRVPPPGEPFEVLSAVTVELRSRRLMPPPSARQGAHPARRLLSSQSHAALRGGRAGPSLVCLSQAARLNPAPFSAYLGFPHGAVLSSSPERFLRVRDEPRRDEADQGHASALGGSRPRPCARGRAANERRRTAPRTS